MERIDAAMLKKLFLSAAAALDYKKDYINELNVFPVPDGDTGTNMTLTIMAAALTVDGMKDPNMQELCKAISSGSLRGARGNSGVILSQLLRGFCKVAGEQDELDTMTLAAAFGRAVDTAYKAVMKPKEGTILTVARAMADKAAEIAPVTSDVVEFLEQVIRAGDEMLLKTPEMLPVLKQAGVVDSGGQGLMEAVRGAYEALCQRGIPFRGITLEKEDGTQAAKSPAETESGRTVSGASRDDIDTADIKFGYCTEFIINAHFDDEQEASFKAYLETMGDSIVCVSDEDFVKIHVHTNDPGAVISKALTFGSLSRIKIDNMREEHEERLERADEPRKPVGFITVSVGEGLCAIFRDLGVDEVIEGGQTMNPSTSDMLDAIDKVNADTVFVFPNNSNIIMAAKQAVDLCEDKKIIVVPTKTVPQGISAMVAFVPEMSVQENLDNMMSAIQAVKSAEVTYSIRDTSIDGFEIREGDIMAIGDKGMLAVEKDTSAAVMKALEKMIDEDSSVVSIYSGADVTDEEAQAMLAMAEEGFPDVEFSLYGGDQPVYYYIISVE